MSLSLVPKGLTSKTGAVLMATCVFLLVAGIGAATTFLNKTPDTTDYRATSVHSGAAAGPDGELLSDLKNYAQSISDKAAPRAKSATSKLLPDVYTMIDRLAERLKTEPNDVEGWRMLGWSYFNTERYELASSAYAKAVALDPNSTQLKQAYELAKTKATDQSTGGIQSTVNSENKPEPSSNQPGPAIRSMVDRLAERLEKSPRDVDGWTRLMRSRVVLGEKTVAVGAFRTALDVFKDNSAASSKITETAIELGLETNE